MATGAWNVIGTGLLFGDTTWIGAGHARAGGGPDGPLAQPRHTTTATIDPANLSAARNDTTRDLLEPDTNLAAEPAVVG